MFLYMLCIKAICTLENQYSNMYRNKLVAVCLAKVQRILNNFLGVFTT
jgi:hypothetical protein